MSFGKKVRYQLEWLVVKWMSVVIPFWPRGMMQAIGGAVGSLAYYCDKRGRQTAIENLTCIFGDEKSDREIKVIAKDSYRSFAKVVMDQFWSPRLNKDNYTDICTLEIEDEEAFEAIKKTGGIFVTPHYSNFEWIAMTTGFLGLKFTIVARDFNNKKLTPIYRKNREMSGHTVISQRGALLRLLKNLKRGGFAAFLSDLTIRPSKAATVIECFGRKVSVTAIHADLMRRTGLPMIAGICKPQPDGRYIFVALKAFEFSEDDTPQTIAQACWDAFEPHIRENPAPWLWMYKHFRYLPKDADPSKYPSYAKPRKTFDEMEERLAKAETGGN